MFTLKATSFLALPLLASAGSSSILGSRAQRRSELLELLQHNHEKRWEQYNQQPLCEVQPGSNNADFTPVDNSLIGATLAGSLTTYSYPAGEDCMSLDKCMKACIVDAASCIAISFIPTPATCTLLGTGYDGAAIQTVPAYYQQLTNAGTTSSSSGGVSAMTVATCATKGMNNDDLLTPAQNNGIVGKCHCGPGRSGKTQFTCQAAGVPSNYFSPDDPPQILNGPVTTTTPITWSAAYEAVPAVMNNLQCASICAQDSNCQAYLLHPGAQLSSCFKIGLSGVYSSPPSDAFNFTPSGSATKVKRQGVAGQTGSFGQGGDIFGKPSSSTIVTNAPSNPGASQRAGLRKRTMRHMGQSQW